MTFAEAKRFSITDYLSRMGFEPSKKRSHEWWYLSPLRTERTPSFKVDTKLNLWYDHGEGKGGTIIDLGALLEKCTYSEFVSALSQDKHGVLSFHKPPRKNDEPERKVELISIGDLADTGLLSYLKSRGIKPETAMEFCKEIDFKIAPSFYKAIGFVNRSGGYELRNSWFKGAASPKDISIIGGKQGKIAVIEGFMDFLSYLELSKMDKQFTRDSAFLVLNSVSLVARGVNILSKGTPEITLYLDNDSAAKSAKEKLSNGGVQFQDASVLYKQYKDLNEYLLAMLKVLKKQHQPSARLRRPKL